MTKLLKNKFFLFLLLIPFFEPNYISAKVSALDKLYKLALVCSCFLILCMVIKRKKISKISLVIIIYRLFLLVVTVTKNGNISGCILNSLYIIFISLIFDQYINHDAKNILSVILSILEILIYINFITILLYPDGMYITKYTENFFLGYDNIAIIYIAPALCISIIYSYMVKGKLTLRTKLLLIISIGTVLIRWTATNIVMLAITTIYIMLPESFFSTKIFNIANYIIVYIVSFVSIIILRIQNLFEYLIVNVLKRSLTFTGRTTIWERNIEYIKKYPILGYGMEKENIRLSKNDNLGHAHNQMLEILYQGGILLLAIFVVIIYIVSKQLIKYKEHKFSKIISIFMLTIFLSMLVEVFRIDYFWIIFILGYHVKSLINQTESLEKGETKWK